MLYLLWVVLNLVLFGFLITLSVKATQLIREKIGILAAIIFVFVILSFATKGDQGMQIKDLSHSSADQSFDHAGMVQAIPDSNRVFKIRLAIGYGRLKKDSSLVVLNGESYLTGVLIGYRWQPQSTAFDPQGTGIKYAVSGTIEWQLLGWVLYRQNKYYTGFIAAQ
jgi:hypothetical protein